MVFIIYDIYEKNLHRKLRAANDGDDAKQQCFENPKNQAGKISSDLVNPKQNFILNEILNVTLNISLTLTLTLNKG